MKKLLLFFGILLTSSSYSQELMNYYIEPDGTNAVTLHTLVYNNTFSSFGSYDITTVDNVIAVTLCYLNTSGQSTIHDFQTNTINLPNGYSTYTINIELYGDNDAVPPCSLENLVDTGIITFEHPYNPTTTTYIPDNVFEDYLETAGFGDDIPNNDLVFTHRIINNTHLFLSGGFIPLSGEIVSMEGLQNFIALRDLRCGGSQNNISSLDVSNNINLEWLWCYSNPISELDLSNNINLTRLNCSNTDITNLDLTNNLNLEWLEIRNNTIASIDLTQNSNLIYIDIDNNSLDNLNIDNNFLLEYLSCSNNLIPSLELANNTNLIDLNLKENQLTELDITNLYNLKRFDSSYNQITILDFSSNPQLEWVFILNNSLTSLNLKNGNNANIGVLVAINNDDLYCIDVDNPDEAPYPDWIVEDQVVFSEDCSLGVEEVLATHITCYPNPVKNILNIRNTSSSPITSIQVFDLLGKLVLSEKSSINQLNVAPLNSGIFFIKIQTEQGVLTSKLVKK